MSVTGAASSTIDMLCLKYPRNIKNVYNDTNPENNSIEIWEPVSCLRQLAHQHQLAQTDLQSSAKTRKMLPVLPVLL